jgi:hypothetical protein
VKTLRIWIDSNLWIEIFHLNGDQKNSARLPQFTRHNSHALSISTLSKTLIKRSPTFRRHSGWRLHCFFHTREDYPRDCSSHERKVSPICNNPVKSIAFPCASFRSTRMAFNRSIGSESEIQSMRNLWALLIACCLSLAAANVRAQDVLTKGTIGGTVTDAAGRRARSQSSSDRSNG